MTGLLIRSNLAITGIVKFHYQLDLTLVSDVGKGVPCDPGKNSAMAHDSC